MGNSVARVSPDPLDRPRITRSTSSGHSRAAPVGAHVPWTTWGRFAHNSPRARVKVHLPRVLESRSVGQRALAPPTDGHPPDYRTIQTLHNHFPCHPPTAFQPRTDATNRLATTSQSDSTYSRLYPLSHYAEGATPLSLQMMLKNAARRCFALLRRRPIYSNMGDVI